jgi:hypothetical protein
MDKIRIPQATSQGYVEVGDRQAFDGSYMKSKTRRGRVQGGGDICPTLMAKQQDIYVVEYEHKEDIRLGPDAG